MSNLPTPYDELLITELVSAVLDDEFDDAAQNENLYQQTVADYGVLVNILERLQRGWDLEPCLDLGCGSGVLIQHLHRDKVLKVHTAVDPNPKRLARVPEDLVEKKVIAFAENLRPVEPWYYNLVICWGTWRFLRSRDEALASVNRVLKEGGLFLFDFSVRSALPLAKWDHPRGLLNRARLFGYELVERGVLSRSARGERHYFVLEKVREFDPRWLRLPQCTKDGRILNYLDERDFYLK